MSGRFNKAALAVVSGVQTIPEECLMMKAIAVAVQ
jgi:hypothetical protein